MSPAKPSTRPAVAFAIPGDLALPTGGYAYDRRVLGLLPGLGVDIRHLQLPGAFPSPTAADLAASRMVMQATAPDTVLLIDGLAYGAMTATTIEAIGRAIIALVHHPLCLEAGLTRERAADLHALEKAALGLAQHTIVTSTATARTLAADFAVPPEKITIAEPGTDPAPRAKGSGAPLHLLAVGSIVPRKGYDVLISALASLRDKPWLLTIVGAEDRSPGTAQALIAQIAEAGLEQRVTRRGAVGDATLATLYDSADIFVMPSLFEGYGMVLAEAMARGLPIVCTTGGAAADTTPDAAARKVVPGSAAAFAQALGEVLVDEPLRREMAQASWTAGQRLPRWEDTARIIAGVIERIAT